MYNRKNILKKLSGIKLVVSDVDGTLTDHNNELGGETKELVKKLREKGVLFTFATQRIHSSIVPFAKELDVDIPIVTVNGALVKDLNNNVISSSVIGPKYIDKALDLADKYFVRIAFCYGEEIVYTEDNSVLRDFMYRLGTDYRLVDSYNNYKDNVLEIIMLGNEKKVMKYIQNKMNFPAKFFLTAKYFRSSSKLGVYHLEVRKSRTNKKTGMVKLAKHLRVKQHEVAVLGDWFNDRDLFEFGGFNVALQNAVAELKHQADYVTERTNDEDGVAEFLKLVYDSK
ncbi:MAG: HAD family hydrolase [Bacteroidetes bacterium]|nr:HAD family hydrolase [Bacteroidota bacterium]